MTVDDDRSRRMGEALRDRRIALLGLGSENRALGEFLRSRGVRFSVCDRRGAPDFAALTSAWQDSVDRWILGADYLAHLGEFDLAFRTPGLPWLGPELSQARGEGLEVSSQTRLFFACSPAPILGVTGTKGKGTTVALIAEILRCDPHVRVGGNIGLPPISFVDELRRRNLVVLELSSFQLQDLDRSPQTAVVLGITQDHLDHHRDHREYVEAKKCICRHQGAADTLIVAQDCAEARGFAGASPARRLAFSRRGEVEEGAWIEGGVLWLRLPGAGKEEICPAREIRLRGPHNHENVAAAAAAAAAVGASTAQIAAGIRSFAGLEHRLEEVCRVDDVLYCNDSLATTPEATAAALRSFEQPTILIAGGSSKGADFAALAAAIVGSGVKAVILMGQEEQRIRAAIERTGEFSGDLVTGCRDMAAAVTAARDRTRAGDLVLLSPGCASFGMFEDYRDRGAQFKRLVQGGTG